MYGVQQNRETTGVSVYSVQLNSVGKEKVDRS